MPVAAMRPVEELVDEKEPGWPVVAAMVDRATNRVEVLPAERSNGERTLLAIQITTRSPMGAIAYQTGGILVDHGWVRLLGSGHPRLPRDLARWNFPSGDPSLARLRGGFLVADDAIGGFFALNGGAFEGPLRNVFYLAPDTLKWEDTRHDYTDLLDFFFRGDLQKFYSGQRWPRWEEDVEKLSGDRGFSFYPFLFARAEGGIETRHRRDVPLDELWRLYVSDRTLDASGPAR